jgi:hypothetical protein
MAAVMAVATAAIDMLPFHYHHHHHHHPSSASHQVLSTADVT